MPGLRKKKRKATVGGMDEVSKFGVAESTNPAALLELTKKEAKKSVGAGPKRLKRSTSYPPAGANSPFFTASTVASATAATTASADVTTAAAADAGEEIDSHVSAVDLSSSWLVDSFAMPSLPMVIEIDSGKGMWALKYAAQHQDVNVLGLEIRTGFVQLALSRKNGDGIGNVHFVACNANAYLPRILNDLRANQVAIRTLTIQLSGPDLKKQTKLLSMSNDLVNTIATAVPARVSVFLQSVIQDEVQHMAEAFAASPCFLPGRAYDLHSLKTNPKWCKVETESEVAARKKGKPVYRMLFERSDVPNSKSLSCNRRHIETKTKELRAHPSTQTLSLSSNWLEVSFATPSLPIAIDIGCAKGTWTRNYAAQHQDLNVLGLEIKTDDVRLALSRKERCGLDNVHFVRCDANIDLECILRDLRAHQVAIRMLTIHFPVPDHHKSLKKQRVVISDLVNVIAANVPVGALVFLQSDNRSTEKSMVKVFAASPFFSPGSGYDLQNLKRNPKLCEIETEREIWSKKEGKPVYRMLFERNDAQ